ncbi:hypothetical protein FACS189413_04400 [Bacteroidia bacterium]|nr:hypothetical protein FACS189413_04400 [Bacteroidia bacterium]
MGSTLHLFALVEVLNSVESKVLISFSQNGDVLWCNPNFSDYEVHKNKYKMEGINY